MFSDEEKEEVEKKFFALQQRHRSAQAELNGFKTRLEKEEKSAQSKEALLSIKHIGDRVNNDAAKHIAATANEEVILGLVVAHPAPEV